MNEYRLAGTVGKRNGWNETMVGKREHIPFKQPLIVLWMAFCLVLFLVPVFGAFIGPTVTFVRNETKANIGNWTHNQSGGYIYWNNFAILEQNQRWKGYVGNITGSLTLDDANTYTIYNWPLATISGEVYATINDTVVNWTGLNCTWALTGGESTPVDTNRTVEEYFNSKLSHTRADNISSTFYMRNHSQFSVGDNSFAAHYCYSIHTFVNDTTQNNSGNLYFHEVVMYDDRNVTNGNIVFATLLETNQHGYNNETIDFQMIVPENGAASWTSNTPYYFYVELS